MGAILLPAGCCCVELGDDCHNCAEGTTPKYWTVTVSGVSVCTGCLNEVDGEARSINGMAFDSVNGIFLLTQTDPNDCIWASDTIGSWSVDEHFGGINCPGVTGGKSGDIVQAYLQRYATKWVFRIMDTTTYDFYEMYAFTCEVAETEDDDCNDINLGEAINNGTWSPTDWQCRYDLTLSGGTFGIGEGGTATFEVGDQT